MKIVRLLSFLLSLCLGLSGCGLLVARIEENNTINQNEEVLVFEIPEYSLRIIADTGFKKNEDSGAWDLQITDGNAYIGVMAYKYLDLAEGQTPKEIYDYQNSDIFSRRENVTVIENESSEILPGKTIIKTGYSAESNGSKNYYNSYLVDFEEDGVFAWVLVNSLPSYLESHSQEFKDIVYTLSITDNDR